MPEYGSNLHQFLPSLSHLRLISLPNLVIIFSEINIHPLYIVVLLYTWCVQVLRSPKEAFAAAMQLWRERCEKCVCLQGDYVEKRLHFQLPAVSSFFLNKLDLGT